MSGRATDNVVEQVVVYLHISEDRTGAEAGVERQREDCLETCGRLGITDPAIFMDDHISAYSGKKRAGYIELLERVRLGPSRIVAWHVARLYRRPRELEGTASRAPRRHAAADAARQIEAKRAEQENRRQQTAERERHSPSRSSTTGAAATHAAAGELEACRCLAPMWWGFRVPGGSGLPCGVHRPRGDPARPARWRHRARRGRPRSRSCPACPGVIRGAR